VTHNVRQPTRVAEDAAFMNVNSETRAGQLVEFGERSRSSSIRAINAQRRTSGELG
jgi:ABC-type phosphate transport system ATPase subunit